MLNCAAGAGAATSFEAYEDFDTFPLAFLVMEDYGAVKAEAMVQLLFEEVVVVEFQIFCSSSRDWDLKMCLYLKLCRFKGDCPRIFQADELFFLTAFEVDGCLVPEK